jgi:hypothetical protein
MVTTTIPMQGSPPVPLLEPVAEELAPLPETVELPEVEAALWPPVDEPLAVEGPTDAEEPPPVACVFPSSRFSIC